MKRLIQYPCSLGHTHTLPMLRKPPCVGWLNGWWPLDIGIPISFPISIAFFGYNLWRRPFQHGQLVVWSQAFGIQEPFRERDCHGLSARFQTTWPQTIPSHQWTLSETMASKFNSETQELVVPLIFRQGTQLRLLQHSYHSEEFLNQDFRWRQCCPSPDVKPRGVGICTGWMDICTAPATGVGIGFCTFTVPKASVAWKHWNRCQIWDFKRLPPFLLIESEEKVSNWHSSGLVERVYSFSRFSVIVSLLETGPTESQNAPARVKQLEAKSRQRHKGHPPFWRDPNLLIRTMVWNAALKESRLTIPNQPKW